jgi:hypothetical protein
MASVANGRIEAAPESEKALSSKVENYETTSTVSLGLSLALLTGAIFASGGLAIGLAIAGGCSLLFGVGVICASLGIMEKADEAHQKAQDKEMVQKISKEIVMQMQQPSPDLPVEDTVWRTKIANERIGRGVSAAQDR